MPYEIENTGHEGTGHENDDINPALEPPTYMFPIIDSFEESMLVKRLMELCPPPPPEGNLTYTRDELEMVPDYAQPFAGALVNISEKMSYLGGDMTVMEKVEILGADLDKVRHFLGIHTLIALYVARVYHLDLNAVLEQAMIRIEHEHAEDKKLSADLEKMNMTPGGSVIVDSATEDEWPDPQF